MTVAQATSDSLSIIWVSDGKAGHESQVQGLLNALACYTRVKVTKTVITERRWLDWLWMDVHDTNMADSSQSSQPLSIPQIIIGAGSRTHVWVYRLSMRYRNARTLVLMRPSWWLSPDFAIIPRHDNPHIQDNILITQGVLNRMTNRHQHRSDQQLILLGGSSKRHRFTHSYHTHLIEQALQLVDAFEGATTIADSRRTPPELMASLERHLSKKSLNVQLVSYRQTQGQWLVDQLNLASQVWVTEDSVNMIYESLTAGCQVGVLPVPRERHDRITKMVDRLIDRNWVTTPDLFVANQAMLPAIELDEANRAAKWLLKQLP